MVLHLIDSVGSVSPFVYAQEHGYRLWMRNGVTFTGNSDRGARDRALTA